MALNIRNAETERLAQRLAERTGETKTEAVRRAPEDRLQWMPSSTTSPGAVPSTSPSPELQEMGLAG